MQNPITTMKAFYNVDKINLKNITEEKLVNIIKRAEKIHQLFLNTSFKNFQSERYLRIMELINSSYRATNPMTNAYATTTPEEKFLLFLFSVDPNFEAAIIYASENKVEDSKRKIREKLGIYDVNLIKIEKAVITRLLNKEKQNEINEEIDRRIYK